ncbi:hypothetical protein F4782DRAFT_523099 [Xylaria castorea]|nr:hypothetical protein F4782DRAFT_523099 [Xylaria castorea]
MALNRPQPDFGAISAKFNDLGQQFSLCENIPAVVEGQEILAALNGITQRLDRIDARLNRIEGRLDNMDLRVVSIDQNSVARLINNRATGPDQALLPLRTPTNLEIDHFPQTTTQLDNLSGPRMADILEQLGQPTGGSVQEKRRRLKTQTGISVQWV